MILKKQLSRTNMIKNKQERKLQNITQRKIIKRTK